MVKAVVGANWGEMCIRDRYSTDPYACSDPTDHSGWSGNDTE